MKVRTNLLAWIGIVLAIIGMGVVLVSSISKWFVLIPVAVLVAAIVALLKGVAFKGIGKAIRWSLVGAWSLVTLFTICTVLVAVFFGWLALLPFVLLCGALIWLVWLVKKTLVWLPTVALVIAIILLGVYAIMGSLLKDWNSAIDTLTVKTLIVENADIENADIENVDVENENVTNQNVESQNVTNQKVENSEVKNQKVEKQEVVNQKVENQTVTNQKVEKPTVNKEDKEDGTKKEENKEKETHKHTYTSKVVAPTCTEKGYTLYTCACGHSYKSAEKEALGHKYNSKVVAPTTESKGYTLHTCERCGHNYKDNYTDKLEPEVTPTIKCAKTIRYEETLYVNLEGIKASNLLVSNKNFVAVENISDSCVAITLKEDVDGYITLTDSVSRVNVVIDIVEG